MPTAIYEFGDFRLEADEKRLLCRGTPVPLAPKVFDTLVVLVESNGRLLTKDDLLKALWPDTFVEEVALAHNISQVRKALRAAAGDGEFVETVPKRGYRFLPSAREVSLGPLQQTTSTLERHSGKTRAHRRRWLIVSAATAVTLATVALSFTQLTHSKSTGSSIGILPFEVSTSDEAVAHLGSGLADALIVRLNHLPRVSVRPASAVQSFDARRQSPAAFGKALRVDTVLAGRVEHDGDRLRVNAMLIRVDDATVVWAQEFDDTRLNLLAVEDSIATRIVASLAPSLSVEDRRRVTQRATSVPDAHDAHLRGRYYWTRRNIDDMRKALTFEQEAVRLDPAYALAWAGLADSILFAGEYAGGSEDILTRARAAATRAIALDASLAQPHATLGLIAMNITWDWHEAERQFRDAIELDPSYATAHAWFGEFLAFMGQFDSGIAELRRAGELDPLSPVIGGDLGKALMLARRYPEAVAQIQHMIELDPVFVRHYEYLSDIYSKMGRPDDSLRAFEVLRVKRGVGPDDPEVLVGRIQIAARAGRAAEAHEYMQRLLAIERDAHVSTVNLALSYGATGDFDNGFACIDRMFAAHNGGVIGLKVDSSWDWFRHDRRFDAVLARAGFTR